MVSIDFLSAAMATIEPLVRKLTTVISPSYSDEITWSNGASLAFYLFFSFKPISEWRFHLRHKSVNKNFKFSPLKTNKTLKMYFSKNWQSPSGFFSSTFLLPVNDSKNSISNWVFKLNLFFDCFSKAWVTKIYENMKIPSQLWASKANKICV